MTLPTFQRRQYLTIPCTKLISLTPTEYMNWQLDFHSTFQAIDAPILPHYWLTDNAYRYTQVYLKVSIFMRQRKENNRLLKHVPVCLQIHITCVSVRVTQKLKTQEWEGKRNHHCEGASQPRLHSHRFPFEEISGLPEVS
jgi:hypothetical protein